MPPLDPIRIRMLLGMVCLLLAGLVTPALGRKPEPPPWEPISPEDLKLAAWPSDPAATAAILLDERSHELEIVEAVQDINAWSITRQRRRLKILKSPALEEAALLNVSVEHGTDVELLWVRARTVQPDGSVREVPREEMRDQLVFRTADGREEWRELRFAFPGVQVGSIVEYDWAVKDETFDWDPWYFRQEVPVRLSRISIRMNPNLFVFRALRNSVTVPLEPKEEDLKGGDVRTTYEVRDIPAFHREPNMPRRSVVRDSVDFLLTGWIWRTMDGPKGYSWGKDWTERCAHSWSLGMEPAVEPGKYARQVVKEVAPQGDLAQKTRSLFDWLGKNLAIVDYPGEHWIWESAEDVLEKRQSYPVGASLALFSLVRLAGVEAYPAFVMPFARGPFREDWPSAHVLGDLAVAIPKPGATPPWTLLFPGRRGVAFGKIPFAHIGGQAIIYRPKSGKIESFEIPGDLSGAERWTAKSRIEGQDVVGDLLIGWEGVVGEGIRQSRESAPDFLKQVREEIQRRRPEVQLGEAGVDGLEEPEARLQVSVPFRIPGAVVRAGDAIEIEPYLFPDPEASPVRLPRTYPVVLPWDHGDIFRLELAVPAGLQAKKLPKALKGGSEDLAVEIQAEVKDGLLTYDHAIRWRHGLFTADTAQVIVEFFDAVARLDRDTAVLAGGGSP